MIGIQTNVFLVFEWIYIFVVSVIIIESDSRQKARLIFEKNETFLSTESKLRKKICFLWNNVTSWKNLRIKRKQRFRLDHYDSMYIIYKQLYAVKVNSLRDRQQKTNR